jgi:hypothetical protein
MAIHYKLRGKQQDQSIEHEGVLTEEQLVGINLAQDSAKINAAIRELHKQGIGAEWEECTLKDTSLESEETYIRYKKRWTHSSKVPARKVQKQ